MSYRLTVRAEYEFDQIYLRGVRDFGTDTAERYAEGLLRIFRLLSDFPAVARERDEVSPPVRVHPFRSHLVIYRIDDEGVLIIRLAHGHEDWETSLN